MVYRVLPPVVLMLSLLAGCRSNPETGSAAAVTGTVVAPDGLAIAYDVRGAGATTLVFIHGWCCDRSFWRNQLDALAEGYRVVSIDLAGHGESGAGRTSWAVASLGGGCAGGGRGA